MRNRPLLVTGICFLLCLFPPYVFNAEPITASDVELQMSRWIGLEQQIDTLRNNWREQEPVLQQQLVLLEKEQQELQGLLSKTETLQDEVEQKRLQLLQEQTTLEQQQQLLEQGLNRSINRMELLYPQLPPPLLDAWRDDMPQLRDEALSSSDRLLLVTEMLTQVNDFQNKITLHDATLQLGDGSDYLVRQVYLGLSQGWYISANGSRAGYGTTSADGWNWQPVVDGDAISRMIRILDGKAAAELVSIPITLPDQPQTE